MRRAVRRTDGQYRLPKLGLDPRLLVARQPPLKNGARKTRHAGPRLWGIRRRMSQGGYVRTTGSMRILVADASRHTRAIIAEILRSASLRDLVQASNGQELCDQTEQHRPRIVITASALPGMSGLDFTKLIRTGLNFVPRETSIILTTDAPTRSFLEAARIHGVDEIVAVPFTTASLMTRVRSVIERPRPFIDCASYVGPCRRRLMLQDYKGARRRAVEPAVTAAPGPSWNAESNRSAVRLCVQKMSEYKGALAPEPHAKLKAVYLAVMKQETREEQERDESLGITAKAFGRYLSTLAEGETPDAQVIADHIDTLHALTLDPSQAEADRTS